MKQKIAYTAAAKLIKDGMKIGLGTGSTARWLISWLKEKTEAKVLKNILIVPTSEDTRLNCEKEGLPVTTLSDPRIASRLDLTIDGADEIDEQARLIKGGGGALLIEKIIAASSGCYAIIAEAHKLVKNLGTNFWVPVEIIPAALPLILNKLKDLGVKQTRLRQAPGFCGPLFSQHGNFILDANFGPILEPEKMEKELKLIPGVVESGIFTLRVDYLFLGFPDGRIEERRPFLR